MKKVLVTGDDGYKAVGIRTLAQSLKDQYEVIIVATKEQRSGAGGSTKAYGEKEWGMEIVDGIKSYWVDGTPADSMEFAQALLPNGVDYLISGINWGENIGFSTMTASGTAGAAIRALTLAIAPKVAIMSWKTNHVGLEWGKDRSKDDATPFLEYPGNSALYIFNQTIENDFWGKDIVNINFPVNPTKNYKLTKLLKNLTHYYKYPVIINEKTYKYEDQEYNYSEETKKDTTYDVGAILSGYISVTPFSIE